MIGIFTAQKMKFSTFTKINPFCTVLYFKVKAKCILFLQIVTSSLPY